MSLTNKLDIEKPHGKSGSAFHFLPRQHLRRQFDSPGDGGVRESTDHS